MTQRDDDWKRISAMAGLDEGGGILPPGAGDIGGIDRSANSFWKHKSYVVTTEYSAPFFAGTAATLGLTEDELAHRMERMI